MAFTEANDDKSYQSILDNAVKFLKAEQWDESKGIDTSDPRFGGTGYGEKSRPDLSNTSFMLDALKAAGLPQSDPAYQRAIVFIRRCQNQSGEGANDLPVGKEINDGGFFYTPVGDPMGTTTEGGLRSYGSMTYAGLKSFLYAGVQPDDFRVQAAYQWIQKHYTLQENPGQGDAGLFYYYHTFAKALAALDVEVVVDDKAVRHSWREDLVKTLLSKQNPDGSWINTNRRWMETDPQLVTAFALMSLGQATRPSEK